MQKYVFIGAGGSLGALLRYYIKSIQIYNYHGSIPLNTFVINVLGSFILALILTVAFDLCEINPSLRLGIATGFLGAFTTFSTFCKETVELLQAEEYFSAISYIILSTVLGLAAAYLGVIFARKVIYKCIKNAKNTSNLKDEGGAN